MFVGQILRPYPLVRGAPALAAVVGEIHAPGGNGDEHAGGARDIGHDGVQTKPSSSRLPFRTMGVIEKAAHQRPGLPRVVRFEERRRLNAAEKGVWAIAR